jgi:hypothetical protein
MIPPIRLRLPAGLPCALGPAPDRALLTADAAFDAAHVFCCCFAPHAPASAQRSRPSRTALAAVHSRQTAPMHWHGFSIGQPVVDSRRSDAAVSGSVKWLMLLIFPCVCNKSAEVLALLPSSRHRETCHRSQAGTTPGHIAG